jgi:acyl-CoA thioesterase-1
MERMVTVRRTLVAVTVALLVALLVAPVARPAPLTGSTWCTNKDSLALIAGSSGTGYLTTGYNSPDGTYSPTAYGWWRWVTKRAANAWGTLSFNYSHVGATTADFLPNGRWLSTTGAVADLGQNQPDLVVISLGTNEYLTQVDPAVFEGNLRRLVQDIHAASPRTAILLAVQWTSHLPNPTYVWEQYKQKIQSVAVSEMAAMVDLRQYLIPASDPDWARFYHPDRIHLLDHSHLVVAAAFWTWLFSC